MNAAADDRTNQGHHTISKENVISVGSALFSFWIGSWTCFYLSFDGKTHLSICNVVLRHFEHGRNDAEGCVCYCDSHDAVQHITRPPNELRQHGPDQLAQIDGNTCLSTINIHCRRRCRNDAKIVTYAYWLLVSLRVLCVQVNENDFVVDVCLNFQFRLRSELMLD